MKKIFLLLLPALVIFGCSSSDKEEEEPFTGTDYAEFITDPNFLAFCLENYDKNNDGKLAATEIQGVLSLSCRNLDIKSLAGIEHFTFLQTLNCSGNKLTELSVSDNKHLTTLNCSDNELTAINLLSNDNLTKINVSGNKIISLDFSNLTALQEIECNNNNLIAVNTTNNPALVRLFMQDNPELSSYIPGTRTVNVVSLNFARCNFTSLDLSQFTSLNWLNLSENPLSLADLKLSVVPDTIIQ